MKILRCLKCGCIVKIARVEAGKSWRCPQCQTPVLSYPREAIVSQNAKCAFCQTTISDSDVSVSCPKCRLEYHEGCWKDNEGCATFGCDFAGYLKKVDRIEPTAESNDSGASTWTSVGGDVNVDPYDGPGTIYGGLGTTYGGPGTTYGGSETTYGGSVPLPPVVGDGGYPPYPYALKRKRGFFKSVFRFLLAAIGKLFLALAAVFRFLERISMKIGNFYVNTGRIFNESEAESRNAPYNGPYNEPYNDAPYGVAPYGGGYNDPYANGDYSQFRQ